MQYRIVDHLYVVEETRLLITDVQTALDLLMTARCQGGTGDIVISRACITDRFFRLSTGLAGAVCQKYIHYGGRLAVYGDFTGYAGRALHDFICECNRGKDFFFVDTERDAIDKLKRRG